MASDCLAKVVLSDVRHNFRLHILTAAGMLLFTPVLFGLSELSERMAAQPMELVSPIIGAILMTPIFMPEQSGNIRDVVRAKKTSHTLVCFLRLLCAAVLTAVFSGILALYMRQNGSQVTFRLFAEAAGGALALGSLGFFASAAGDSPVIGYMAAFSYFFANLFLRDKFGLFSLFRFTDGMTDVSPLLYAAAAVLTLSGLAFRRLTEQYR